MEWYAHLGQCISQGLQRNRPNRIYINFIHEEIYYKELAHTVMEAGKCRCQQDELADWRHREPAFQGEPADIKQADVPVQRQAGR